MGVPVITLQGSHYASRMSTAVLAGAQLDDWIVDSPDNYVSKAKESSLNLTYLRKNRTKLRHHLQRSPLGDPMGLMHALENAFSAMARQHVVSVFDSESQVLG